GRWPRAGAGRGSARAVPRVGAAGRQTGGGRRRARHRRPARARALLAARHLHGPGRLHRAGERNGRAGGDPVTKAQATATGANMRFSAWAVRTDHDTVNTIAAIVRARLTTPFSATNVVVGRLTNSTNVVTAERKCTPAHISVSPLKSRVIPARDAMSGCSGQKSEAMRAI